jgi:exonuclease SbcC
LKTEEEALPGLESSAKEQAEALKSAEQQTARTKEKLKSVAPTLQKVRSLDLKLADQRKAVSEVIRFMKRMRQRLNQTKSLDRRAEKNDPGLRRRWSLWTATSRSMHRMNG